MQSRNTSRLGERSGAGRDFSFEPATIRSGSGGLVAEAHLARPESAAPTRLRGNALRRGATIATLASSVQEADRFATEALAIGRELGDDELTARALNELGYIRFQQLDLEAAQQALGEALDLARRLDNPTFTAGVLLTLGEVHRECEDDAAPLFAEALELHRLAGN